MLKIVSTLIVAGLLAACATQFHGGLVIEGKPVSVVLKENLDGIILHGYEVVINGQSMGVAKRSIGSEDDGSGAMYTNTYEPLESPMGKIELKTHINVGSLTHDVYVNGVYAGTVHCGQ